MSARHAISLTIDSRLENVALLGVATRGIARQLGFSEDEALNVELCVVEAASNCIRHAYRGEAGHPVVARITARRERLEIVVEDEGRPIPEDKREPRPIDFDPSHIGSIPEGGRGVFLVHALMDTVEYGRDGGRNVLVMTKALQVPPPGRDRDGGDGPRPGGSEARGGAPGRERAPREPRRRPAAGSRRLR
jgi:serine/threonine-protein kinase RsbW